ncbi:LysR family transcriptional regulator [Chitinimonas sp.]|uniref:LysR family transcriptional regulator n=1 Tax=Chitinimonas sp. TaxID=1934313 RepID=UPI002F92EF96
MALRRVDLNLFRVFEAVMRHRSIRAASRELHITPSAVSHALSRLRVSLGDNLFVASETGMEPTARALELAPHVRGGLERIDAALRSASFEPAQSMRTFRIAASDYACSVVLPQLVAQVARSAPQIDIRVFPFSRLDTIRQLDDGRIDIVIGWFNDLPQRMHRKLICEDNEALVVRRGHPLASGELSRERLLAYPHVVVELTGSNEPTQDGFLQDLGVSRRVWVERLLLELGGGDAEGLVGRAAVSVPHYASVLPLIEASDMVATLPRRYVQAAAEQGRVAVLDIPFEPLIGRLEAIWHQRGEQDEGLQWLIGECLMPLGD